MEARRPCPVGRGRLRHCGAFGYGATAGAIACNWAIVVWAVSV